MTSATEHLQPADGRALSVEDFARIAGLSARDVTELMQYDLLAPAKLDMRTALALREAVRVRSDFDLDLFTTGLLAGYLRRIADMQAEIDALTARQPARAVYTEVSFTEITLTRSS